MSHSLQQAMPAWALWKNPYPFEEFGIDSIETCFGATSKEADPNYQPCNTRLSDSTQHNVRILLALLSLSPPASPIAHLVTHYLTANLMCEKHKYKAKMLWHHYRAIMFDVFTRQARAGDPEEYNERVREFDEWAADWSKCWGDDGIKESSVRYFNKHTAKLLKRSHDEFVAHVKPDPLYTCLINCELVTRQAPTSMPDPQAPQPTGQGNKKKKKRGSKKPKNEVPTPDAIPVMPNGLPAPGQLTDSPYSAWSHAVYSTNQSSPQIGATTVGPSFPPYVAPMPPYAAPMMPSQPVNALPAYSYNQSIFGDCGFCYRRLREPNGCISSTIDIPSGFLDVHRACAPGLVRCAGPSGCSQYFHHRCANELYWHRINSGVTDPIRCPHCNQLWVVPGKPWSRRRNSMIDRFSTVPHESASHAR